METFQESIIYIEIVSLILSIMFVKSFKSKHYYFFIIYLFFAIVADGLGGYFAENGNFWVFNMYTFFEYSSVAGIYYFLNSKSFSKKVVFYASIIFYGIYAISFIYKPLQSYTVIILHFFVVPFLFFYLQELLNSEKIINYKKQLFFWITVGLLLYYFGTLPFVTMSFIGRLQNRILFIVPAILVVIMHFIFIVNLIWLRKVRK
jgi:hypothetical protein